VTTTNTGWQGTPQAYTVASSLTNGSYDLTATVYDSTANKPTDVLFDYSASVPANSTGNKQIILYVQGSMDNSFPPGPTGSTDTTHDTSMLILGSIPTNGGANAETVRPPKPLSIAAAFGGWLPQKWRVFIKNDCGVAITSCSARTTEINLLAV
jgi:hypothetical protein